MCACASKIRYSSMYGYPGIILSLLVVTLRSRFFLTHAGQNIRLNPGEHDPLDVRLHRQHEFGLVQRDDWNICPHLLLDLSVECGPLGRVDLTPCGINHPVHLRIAVSHGIRPRYAPGVEQDAVDLIRADPPDPVRPQREHPTPILLV